MYQVRYSCPPFPVFPLVWLKICLERYYNRRLLPYTRRRRAGQNPTAAAPVAPEDEAMDIVAFTTSVENVLSAFLNRNRNIEYRTGLVQLVAPVR